MQKGDDVRILLNNPRYYDTKGFVTEVRGCFCRVLLYTTQIVLNVHVKYLELVNYE